MATLSGQTIQSTYQGLLKLSDSTSGITNTFQSIEDGLGNDTGMKIKTNFLTQNNQLSIGALKNNFFGVGITNSTANPNTTNHNVINSQVFYDQGIYSYSAITFNLASASTTSDVFQAAFYTSEMGSNGLFAKDLIISGITASTTGLGAKTYVFPNHISFSATPGLNFFVNKFSSAGSIRSCNFNSATMGLANAYHYWSAYGFQLSPTPNVTSPGYKFTTNSAVFSGLTTFNQSYVESDFSSVANAAGNNIGFVLHTVK